MSVRALLTRAGQRSPLLPAGLYVGALTLANLATTLAPGSALVALATGLLWLAAVIALVVIVTWYRDDDWLAAGFLIGLAVLVGELVATLAISIVSTRSLGPALFSAVGSVSAVFVRAIILVPLSGGCVALARWITRRLRRRPRVPAAPAA